MKRFLAALTVVLLLGLVAITVLEGVTSGAIVPPRYEAENMAESSGFISVQADPDGTGPAGPNLRWASGAGVADTARQENITVPAGTTVTQIQFFTRQGAANTAEFAIYVGGTALANQVGFFKPPAGSVWGTVTINLTKPIGDGTHTLYIGPKTPFSNAAFIDWFELNGTGSTPPPDADGDPFPGIRWLPTMGVYAGANKGWVSEPGLIDQQYADYVSTANEDEYLDLDADNERYWFCGGRKFTWADVLVNQSQAPTSRAQAQDPNWSNYKWNQNDYIDQMLDNSSAVAANKAKMCLFVAVSATSVTDPVPTWMEQDTDKLTWTDGQGKVHVRFDKTEAVNHTADFLIALAKKYGTDTRIDSLTIGEYYTNPDGGGLPADLDYAAFRSNMKQVWSQVIAAVPRDANGERMTIAQTEPIVSGGYVTAQDIANIGIGISGSGAQLFSFDRGALDPIRLQLYGVVPMQHQVNSGTISDRVTWDGTPNPWGFTAGQAVPGRYEYIAWHYGSKGPIPLDSLMMRDDSNFISQWHEAYQKFGPNGSLVAQWGQIPNYPA